MAKIAPLTGTTDDYNAVEDNLILADREIGVEIASRTDGTTYVIVRQGNGKDKFHSLPKLFDQSSYEDALKTTTENMSTVTAFKNNMNAAAANANNAATLANEATTKANAAAKACEGIVVKQNTMVDTVTGKSGVLSLEDGIICVREA